MWMLTGDAARSMPVACPSGHILLPRPELLATRHGLSNAGKALADGAYKIKVEAKRSDGTSLDVSTHVLVLVSWIVNAGSNPQLVIGDAQVPLSEVLSVNLPAAMTSTTVDG